MHCRVCDATDLELVIDLGLQPWCNNFLTPDQVGKEPFYPLRLVYCKNCSTSQLDYTVKKEVMFGDHTYLSGITQTLSNHFKAVAADVYGAFLKDKAQPKVLDIGSNDGTQLVHYKDLGCEVLGVESSKRIAQIANDRGIRTLNEFFNLETVERLGESFDIINAAGVFFHLEELHSVCKAIKKGLAEDGVFVVQFLYMKSIMDNMAFDQIYHEHLLYYTLKTIGTLLARHGLELFDARLEPIHGGSIIAYATHTGTRAKTARYEKLKAEEDASGCNDIAAYKRFAEEIYAMKERNLAFLKAAKAAGKTVYGFGAPVKGNTMLNFFGVGPDLISCLIERNEMRRGTFAPGSHIPLLIEDEVETQPDIYFVLAWNFKDEILARNKALIDAGVEFYFPVNPK